MRHIQVAAEDDRFFRIQSDHIIPQGILKTAAVLNSLQAVLRIRRIAADQEEILKFQCDHAAFVVMLLFRQTIRDRKRRDLRKNSRSAVAFLLRAVPVFLIVRQIHRDLAFLQLGFLQAENICVKRSKIRREILAENGTQAVHVPGDELHA